jgi:hypothetical protein
MTINKPINKRIALFSSHAPRLRKRGNGGHSKSKEDGAGAPPTSHHASPIRTLEGCPRSRVSGSSFQWPQALSQLRLEATL